MTKAITAVFAILLILLVIWRFQELITPLIIALILAYLLHPVINFITRRTGWKRGWVTMLVYALTLFIWIVLAVVIGVIAIEQVSRLLSVLPSIIQDMLSKGTVWLTSITDHVYEFGPFSVYIPNAEELVNLTEIESQAARVAQQSISNGGSVMLSLAQGIFSKVTLGLLMFVVSLYIARDLPKLGNLFTEMARFPGYQDDANRLTSDTAKIWNAYLRGQITLALIVGSVVAAFMWGMGVRYALALGVLAGLMEFLPIIGPTISTVVAIIVSLVFGSSHFPGMSPIAFAGIILVFMTLVQQIENAVLAPRIVGGALELHPLVIIIGVLMGGTLAGVLGAILAAPVLATLKLFGSYAAHKMFDLPPFDELDVEEAAEAESVTR